MEIDVKNRSVDRVFIQGEIVGLLSLVSGTTTVATIWEWMREIKSLDEYDTLALHMEITNALNQLEREDGIISIIGEAHSAKSAVSLNQGGLREFANLQ